MHLSDYSWLLSTDKYLTSIDLVESDISLLEM